MTIKIDAKIVGYEVVKPEEEAAVKEAAQQEKEEKSKGLGLVFVLVIIAFVPQPIPVFLCNGIVIENCSGRVTWVI